jgi:hypothetical protein
MSIVEINKLIKKEFRFLLFRGYLRKKYNSTEIIYFKINKMIEIYVSNNNINVIIRNKNIRTNLFDSQLFNSSELNQLKSNFNSTDSVSAKIHLISHFLQKQKII